MPQPRSPANRARSSRASRSSPADGGTPTRSEATEGAEQADELTADLTYNEARTALDLTMAALQSSDLAVEEMAGLYRRATAYADRCRELLEAVEQEVIQWEDPLQIDG